MLREGRLIRKPLSCQVRDELREMIRVGKFRIGEKLPSEEALVNLFGVSRGTVREALKSLEQEHIIVCRRGRGRFLTGDPQRVLNEEVNRLQSVTELAQSIGFDLQTEVLSLKKQPANDYVRSRLELLPTELVFVLERVRRLDQKTVIYSIDIFPEKLSKTEINPSDFAGSLVKIMEEKWNTRLAYSRAEISAQLLDPVLCKKFNVDCLSPWLLMEQVNYDEYDRPILYSKDYHLSDLIHFHVIRRRI